MKDKILNHIDEPEHLEALYRTNKSGFIAAFDQAFVQIQDHPVAQTWHHRIHYSPDKISKIPAYEWLVIAGLSLIAWGILKIPNIFHLDASEFYTRNWAFIIFPTLSVYFMWKNRTSKLKVALTGFAILATASFINILEGTNLNIPDTTILAWIHLPLFLWSVLGIAFVGNSSNRLQPRLAFLKYSSELIIITPIITTMVLILSAITIWLFNILGIDIVNFFSKYILTLGIASAPIIGTHIIQTNSNLVSKVAPAIAKVFSPLVLLTLIAYTIAMPFSQNNLYQDRDYLLMFNILLIGVMALILFSIIGTVNHKKNRMELRVLFSLASIAIIINGISLSVILTRALEGLTANRLAVLGGNILILVHLILVSHRLFLTLRKDENIEEVKNIVARFLPIYIIWTMIVLFIFPVIFKFK